VSKTTARPPKVGIGRLLRTASTAFNRVFKMHLEPQGVSYGQFQYLQSLWEGDGLTQTELTRKVGVEMASSTAILDSLEQRGFIKRRRNSSDRRKIYVYLTAEGASLEKNLMACAVATNVMACRGLSKAEVLALFKILGRVIDNMNLPAEVSHRASSAPRGATRRPVAPLLKAARSPMPREA
jgi:MarR family transcriptional regulator, organic hydroperoxide resistance regulator